MRRLAFLMLFLAALLAASAQADELYVRNRPYKGTVTGSGNQIAADLPGLLKALGAKVTVTDGVATVSTDGQEPDAVDLSGVTKLSLEGKDVPVEGGMVKLKALADAWGVKLVVNKEMGTVDLAVPREKAQLSAKPYLLVMFSTSWCGYCKQQEPDLRALAVQYPKMEFLKVDVEHPGSDPRAQALKRVFPGGGVPQTYLFDSNSLKVLTNWTGYRPGPEAEKTLKPYLR